MMLRSPLLNLHKLIEKGFMVRVKLWAVWLPGMEHYGCIA